MSALDVLGWILVSGGLLFWIALLWIAPKRRRRMAGFALAAIGNACWSFDYYVTGRPWLCVVHGVLAVLLSGVAANGVSDSDCRVISHAVADHHLTPSDRLEIILDGPGNWRLKAARKPGRVRLADYRMHMIGKPEDPGTLTVDIPALEDLREMVGLDREVPVSDD